MHLKIQVGGSTFTANTDISFDLSMAVSPYTPALLQPQTFGLPGATASPFSTGSFTCAVDAGASVNCPVVSLCPHSNGTHTECVGHILPGRVTLKDMDISRHSGLCTALLLTATASTLRDSGDEYAPGSPEDLVIGCRSLQEAMNRLAADNTHFATTALACLSSGGLILRTQPSPPHKHPGRWTGTNPIYLTPGAVGLALALGVKHLLVDLPSLDREDDKGAMLSHRAWWDIPPGGPVQPTPLLSTRTITELISVDQGIVDGPYLLNLQVAPLDLDAAPSRPVVYPLLAN